MSSGQHATLDMSALAPGASESNPWIDATAPVHAGMPVYPGDPAVQLLSVCAISAGAAYSASELRLCTHTGTHVDPPVHFLPGRASVDQIPLDHFLGLATVVDVAAQAISSAVLAEAVARVCGSRVPERILLRTEVSRTHPHWPWEPPLTSFPYLTADGAAWVVERGVKLIGIDYLSVDAYDSTEFPAHKTLLGAGVTIVEGVFLPDVREGSYEMACLPLRIVDGDGSPARVVLRRLHA